MKQPLSDLCKALPKYRTALKQAWSAQTVHPDWTYRPHDPAGQCAPTALWVMDLLQKHGHPARLTWGPVTLAGRDSPVLGRHAWVAVDDLVIDLTASQGAGIDDEVIYATYSELGQRGILYTPSRSTAVKKELDRGLQARYGIFLAALPGKEG